MADVCVEAVEGARLYSGTAMCFKGRQRIKIER